MSDQDRSGLLVTITTNMPSRSGDQNMWFIAEVSERTIDELWDAMKREGGTVCDRLHTRKRGDTFVESGRERMILGLQGVQNIRACHARVEAAGT